LELLQELASVHWVSSLAHVYMVRELLEKLRGRN
jgi:hypothetical protein